MKSGVIQSLSYYLPDTLAVEDGRFLMDLNWFADDSTTPITQISAGAPPASVTLRIQLFEIPGRTPAAADVTLVVREDSPAGAVAAFQTLNPGLDPWAMDQNQLATLEVEFDPQPSIAAGANGFFAELVQGDDPEEPPYFTTNWNIYQQIDDLDMTKAAYTLQYATYGQWPYSLQILSGGAARHASGTGLPKRDE